MATLDMVGLVAILSVVISFLLGILMLQIVIRYLEFDQYKITLTPETKRKLTLWNTSVKSLEAAFVPFILILCITIPLSFFPSDTYQYFTGVFFMLPFIIILAQFRVLWQYYRDFGRFRAFISFIAWWGPSFLIIILMLYVTGTYMIV